METPFTSFSHPQFTAAPVTYGVTTIGGSSLTPLYWNQCAVIATGSDALGYSANSISAYISEAGSGTLAVAIYSAAGAFVAQSGASAFSLRSDLIVAADFHLRAQFAQHLHQVVGERIVIVEDKNHGQAETLNSGYQVLAG
jgi:hypothetical protein